MRRKVFFRLAWVMCVLLFASLGCQLVNNVRDVVALASEAVGLATDIDIEGLATDIDLEGIATEVDLEQLATEMEAITTEIDLESLITDIPLLDETPETVATPIGFPSDIPIMEGDKYNMSGTPTQLEYSIDVEVNAAVDFYRREMAARGWAEQSNLIIEGEAELVFQKGARKARVKITEDFFFGVMIEILLEG
ncbi:MAG: hypothetical protein QME21_08155 [Anaerolineales bacterium]|nr:hypothetical protein [Anaerolineales bacterium]